MHAKHSRRVLEWLKEMKVFSYMQRAICKYWWMLVVAALVAAVGQVRFIARDEGFYLLSAKLISQGSVPYRDFFFPQAPLMPYLYSVLFRLFGPSWVLGRLAASVFALGCVWFLYLIARKVYGERSAKCCVLLVTCSAAFQLWMPLAKNVGLGLFFLLVGLYLFLVKRNFFLAGVFVGLCALTRFTFAPLVVLFFVPLSKHDFWRQARSLALGLVPAAAVVVLFLYLSPQNFIEHNFTYHTQRTRFDEEAIENNKRFVLMALVGLRECIGGGGLQFCTLLLGAIGSLWVVPRGSREHQLFLACIVVFFALSFVPSPTYVQYFSVVAVLASAPAAHCFLAVTSRIKLGLRGDARLAQMFLMLLVVLCYCQFGIQDFRRFFVTGEKVIGVGARNHESWRMAAVSRASQRIDELNVRGKPVYVTWPGYLLEASSSALPGSESNFGVGWANTRGFSEHEESSRRVISRRGIVKAFSSGEVDVLVLFLGRGRVSELEKEIREQGAKRVDKLGGLSFFMKAELDSP